MLSSIIAVAVFILSFTEKASGYSSYMVYRSMCPKPIKVGNTYMGYIATLNTTAKVKVSRTGSSTILNSNDKYSPGETLTVRFSHPEFGNTNYVIETTGGNFVLDFHNVKGSNIGCSGNTRFFDESSNSSLTVSLKLPDYGDVAIVAAWATGINGIRHQVYVTEIITLKGLSAPPSFQPAAAPVTSSSSSSSCFAGSETVLLASGENKNIENVVIGDEILVSSLDGKKLSYSPVIAIPHAANNDAALFVVLDTESRRQLKLTGDHLVVGGDCGSVLSLVTADSLNINDCLLTTSGEDVITAITFVKGHGVYTVVTKDGALIVVNGIVASPFAVNHLLADSFYNIHRFLFKLVSFDFLNKFSMSVTNVFGDIVLSLF